jgi:hypothetical protein
MTQEYDHHALKNRDMCELRLTSNAGRYVNLKWPEYLSAEALLARVLAKIDKLMGSSATGSRPS